MAEIEGGEAVTTGPQDLPVSLLQQVFSRLTSVQDLCSAIMACKLFRDTGAADLVWRALAEQAWPAPTLVLGTGYSNHQELVRDDNRRNAVLSLDLHNMPSTYKHNTPEAYYQCRLLSLQWWRSSNQLRLYFEARGELDLRHPLDSGLAVVHKHSGGIEFLQPPAQSSPPPLLQQALDAAVMLGPALLLGPAVQLGPAGAVLQDAPDMLAPEGAAAGVPAQRISWLETFNCWWPDAMDLVAGQPGHFKGCLVWNSATTTEVFELLHGGCQLIFVYANTLLEGISAPDADPWPDYTTAELLAVPEGFSAAQALQEQGSFELLGVVDEQLEAESEEQERHRWRFLPEAIKERGAQWPGAVRAHA